MIIKNDQQYWAIRAQVEKFEQELASLENQPFTPVLEEYAASLQGQMEELIYALQEYEAANS